MCHSSFQGFLTQDFRSSSFPDSVWERACLCNSIASLAFRTDNSETFEQSVKAEPCPVTLGLPYRASPCLSTQGFGTSSQAHRAVVSQPSPPGWVIDEQHSSAPSGRDTSCAVTVRRVIAALQAAWFWLQQDPARWAGLRKHRAFGAKPLSCFRRSRPFLLLSPRFEALFGNALVFATPWPCLIPR